MTPAELLGMPAELLDMTGKVVLVTGASGNIGAGIAKRFWQSGASVVAHSRTTSGDSLRQTLLEDWTGDHVNNDESRASASRANNDESRASASRATTTRLSTAAADLTVTDAPSQLIAEVLAAQGRLDALVNCAGIQPVVPFADLTDQQWQEMIDVNLTAVHRLTQAAAEVMRTQSAGGAIVHVASIEAHQPTTEHGHYATAKAGLVMHAKAAALSYGEEGIRVNSVSPGLIGRPGIETDWPEGVQRWQSAAPLGRLGTPEDVGDACLFLCSDLARWITGIDLVVDGGVLTRPTW